MDYGTLTDNQGRKANFRQVILLMTSNCGAREAGKDLIGFGERPINDSEIDKAIENTFSPEFRNRLDAVIKFKHLSKEIMVSIVKKELGILSNQLGKKNILLRITDECVGKLAEEGYCREFGARQISRIIEIKIKSLLIEDILFGKLRYGGVVKLDLVQGIYCKEIIEYNLKKLKPKTLYI